MSKEIKRHFKGSAPEMLTAIAAIVQAAIDNKAELIAKRASWADPFLPNLQAEVNKVVQTYLGADSAKDLRQATMAVVEIQEDAISSLEEVKVQIERDFRNDKPARDELLNELGYTDFFKAARRKDQGALVQLLYRFKQALPGLQSTLTTNGVDAGTLTAITGFADDLNNANISQEGFKSSRKGSTEEALIAFNDIFDKVMDVAVIAANLFKGNKAKQERFNYAKALKTQGAANTGAKTVAPQPAPAA